MDKLKDFLKENKITLKELAIKVTEINPKIRRYSPSAYSLWISGKREWKPYVALAILEITSHKITIGNLYSERDKRISLINNHNLTKGKR